MIIQCNKCDTKFRFDESLITGDGAWVRCSRCQHVFFHDNPIPEGQAGTRPDRSLEPSASSGEETGGLDRGQPMADRGIFSDRIREEEVEPIICRVQEIQEVMETQSGFGGTFKEFDGLEEAGEGKEEAEEAGLLSPGKEVKKKSSLGRVVAYLGLFVFIIALLGGVYLWAVPQDRQAAVDILDNYLPIYEWLGKDQQALDRNAARVSLQDIRQRFVNNWLLGNLRVVEGTAVNRAKYSLTQIQIRGKLYDAGGNMLWEKVSFCGNILTEAELATLTEEEMQKRLSLPLGSSIPSDQVKPNGQIPFMIVFAHEPRDVTKVTVVPAAAEKLLE